ncbi:family 43 glycosylhydrolase [Phytoactinopolyspora alkaliphila]|uniref:Family 43 glycosylhydrolase n=1 Tax=Phytoactinopolyspora alkaliphila TaxID=1783498 RepID=A0A6N9YMR0_9ACTN|nr:family 43 glycosylhydrolase [Phytoactinopolyspora alkaliphila]NED96148.1 family 43 glycosylhydrolase [Phytoactinopolyspora alkaliphila]
MPRTTTPARIALGALITGALVVSSVAASAVDAGVGANAPAPGSGVTTQNPISGSFSDTYADPAVIRGKDGYWYMYATSDPLHSEPSEFGLMHVARTLDFADWEYLGTILDDADRPGWTTSSSFYWAPDIRYVDGQYMLYYTATDTVAEPGEWNFAIGVATAPTPAGPWTDSGGPVVAPRPDGGGGYFNTIDPALFADDDGTRYLYFGGYHGGLWVTELDDSGTRAVGAPVQVARPDRYEGAFVVKRDGYYYLTASSANCCAGPVTGYSVYAGRSESPLGPFVDHEGVSMLDSRVGGTQVLAQNGNRWIGVGHHAIITDVSGQDHIVYHAIDRDDAWLNQPGGVNRRPALIDRLDWIDGWPVTRAGAGPSDTPQPAPVTASALGIDSADPASGDAVVARKGRWITGTDTTGDAGAIGRLVPDDDEATVTTRRAAPRSARVEMDLRFAGDDASFSVGLAEAGRTGITVTVDPSSRELSVEVRTGRGTSSHSASLPSRFDPSVWSSLAIEMREDRLTAEVSESRLGDLDAKVAVDLPAGAQKPRPVRLTATSGEAQVTNLTVVPAHEPVTEAVPEPVAGEVLVGEEFSGEVGPGWTWVRPDESITVDDDTLRWPLDSVDVVGAANTGPLLLRTPPEGDWIVETKLHLDLGTDTIRNYQQAGLIVHADDDLFARLGSVAIWSSRQVEFGKELADGDRLEWGAHLGGPVAETMWLRIAHTVDPDSGDLLYRSASSRDGETWRWGATWTLPAGSDPRVGLYAGGGAVPATTAVFEYIRFHEQAG